LLALVGGPAKDQPLSAVVRCRKRRQDVAPVEGLVHERRQRYLLVGALCNPHPWPRLKPRRVAVLAEAHPVRPGPPPRPATAHHAHHPHRVGTRPRRSRHASDGRRRLRRVRRSPSCCQAGLGSVNDVRLVLGALSLQAGAQCKKLVLVGSKELPVSGLSRLPFAHRAICVSGVTRGIRGMCPRAYIRAPPGTSWQPNSEGGDTGRLWRHCDRPAPAGIAPRRTLGSAQMRGPGSWSAACPLRTSSRHCRSVRSP
jgi:hypothetical protein